MAEALLAKLYINWAVYTCDDVATYDPSMTNSKLNDVIKYCDDIIASGHFNLSDGYRKKFMPDNGYQIKDFIYAMPYQIMKHQPEPILTPVFNSGLNSTMTARTAKDCSV